MLILIDSNICRRDVDLNAAKLLFNPFDCNCQTITESLKFKFSGILSLRLFKKSVNYFDMKHAKPKLIKVKYINCNSLILRNTIISNVYSSESVALYLLENVQLI